MSGGGYYPPYDSNESGSSSDSDSDDSMISDEQDPRYAIINGPSLKVDSVSAHSSSAPGAPWDPTTNISSLKNYVYLDTPKSTKTSLITIKSINRDKIVWPTPFRFQLKLPRVYKDIAKFQLVQMSFPNNASNVLTSDLYTSSIVQLLLNSGVPESCIATCVGTMDCSLAHNTVGLIEQGRTNPAGAPLLGTVVIPSGSYSDPQLASELTTYANSTPPLNLISFSTFQDCFQNTRDILPLFNEPGDSYCSRLSNQKLCAHTKENIMNTYYTQQHIDSLGDITEDVAFVAYYFPILKEAMGTGIAEPFLSTTGLSFSEVKQAILGPFQGFTSPLYSTLCHVNQTALDGYRPHLTFERRPINKYTWSYQEQERRFTTLHDTLNTSLMRDLKKQYSTTFTNELSSNGLNGNTFQTLKTNQTAYQSVYKHLERNLSSVLGAYHLVSGYSYQGGDAHFTTHSTFLASTLDADSDFTAMFQYKSTVGRIFGNYAGTNMQFRTFADYHSTLSSYYQLSQSTQKGISTIQGTIQAEYHTYVSTKYANVLPSSMIQARSYLSGQGVPVSFVTNQSLYVPGMTPPGWAASGPIDLQTLAGSTPIGTVPLGFVSTATTTCLDICCYVLQNLVNSWYSNVPVNTVVNSLAYRMGHLNMQPTQFNILSTLSQVTSTHNTHLLMQINDEQGFNNMDVTMPEDYSRGNDPTGQVKFISGKILMGALGDTGVSQTVIQNPTIFENTLGKLDHLDFKIFYDDAQLTPAWRYLPFFVNISEWDATFQIDEQVGFANQGEGWGPRPTLAIPENPDATPYLYYMPKGDDNNNV